MDKFLGLTGTGWTAIYTLLTLGLLVVATATAWVALGQWKAVKGQIADARRAELEVSRPYVLVTAEESRASKHLFDLVIRNIGRRPALNVEVDIDPPPARVRETHDEFILANIKMLNEPIAMIAPDQELRAFWDSHIERNGRTELPNLHSVHVNYVDSSGHSYVETSVIDLDANRGALFTEVGNIHTLGQTLDKMLDLFKTSSVLGRQGELTVEATTEPRRDHAERVAREALIMQRKLIESELWAQQLLSDQTPGKEERIVELTAKLKEWDDEHPDLAGRDDPDSG